MIKNSAYRMAFVSALVAISCGYEIFFLQVFESTTSPTMHAIIMACFLTGAMAMLVFLMKGSVVAQKNRSYKKHFVEIKVSKNGLVASHNNTKDVIIGANFSEGDELIAHPKVFYEALVQSIKSALKSTSDYAVMSATLEVSLEEGMKISDGQAYIVRQIIKACRPMRIIDRF